jgi:beta-lactamase regulating signal transducer with metallopeptidase domain
MQLLQHILLSNAAGAAVLAAVVWPICCLCRRPALCRALWILVLFKLLTPPLVPVYFDKWMGDRAVVQAPTPPSSSLTFAPDPELQVLPRTSLPPAPPKSTPSLLRRALTSLPIIWTTGTLLFLTIGLVRVLMLLRLLARAPLAPDSVQLLINSVAARLGIAKPPRVCFVAGVVCPALWAFARRPRVIIPLSLWNRLDEPKRRTLLAHELAHLRRGDHWVRLLEFTTFVIYWWHPAVWVARRQIHDFEEQCCDAWVLWAMPASAHTYGSALLEAVDFVSATRPMRPALSAGLGEFRHLKRRLLMIKQGTVPRALSRTSLAAVLGAAAFALPFAPTLGQVAGTPPALPPGPAAESAPAPAPEIVEARARVQRLQRELAEARSRLAILERGGAPATGAPSAAGAAGYGSSSGGTTGYGTAYIGGPGGYIAVTPAQPGAANALPPSTSGGIMGGGTGTMGGGGGSVMVAPAPDMPPHTSGTAPMGMGGFGRTSAGLMTPAPAQPPRMGSGAMGGYPSTSSPNNDAEQRLQRLDRQLRELMDQVRELREVQERQLHDGQRHPQPSGANP